jgi:hypothetical protein
MKHKNIIIGIVVLAIVTVLFLFAKPFKMTRAPIEGLDPDAQFTEEQLHIRDKLLAKTIEYRELEGKQYANAAKINQLQLENLTLEDDKQKIAVTARSWDHILCSEHGLVYVRPGETGSGALQTGSGACTGF